MRLPLKLLIPLLIFGLTLASTAIGFWLSYTTVIERVYARQIDSLYQELSLLQAKYEQFILFKHPEGINQSVATLSAELDNKSLFVTNAKGIITASSLHDDVGRKWNTLNREFSEKQYYQVLKNSSPLVTTNRASRTLDGMITICQSNFHIGLRGRACGVTILRKDLNYHLNFAKEGLIKQSLYLIIGGAISASILSLLFHFSFTRRVVYLKEQLQQWQSGNRGLRLKLIGNNEISDITKELNHLVHKFEIDEKRLEESQQFNEAIIDASSYAIISTTTQGIIKSFNQSAETLLGYSADELIDKETPAKFHDLHQVTQRGKILQKELRLEQPLTGFDVFIAKAKRGQIYEDEWTYIQKDGRSIAVWLSISAIKDANNNIRGYLGIAQDISEKKEADRRLFMAEKVFNNTSEGIVITDENLMIININNAYSKITGYTAKESIGQKVSLSKSGHHSPDFYHQMWKEINQHGRWSGEIWDRKKTGEIYPKLLTINSVKRKDGSVCNYIGIFKDITLQKLESDQLTQLAYSDHLTQLANRTLFHERLEREILTCKRKNKGKNKDSGNQFALLYLDLNRFKPINDTHGHDIGDDVLVKVAQRLRKSLRKTDTVARLGGDEFAIILSAQEASFNQQTIEKVITAITTQINKPFHIRHLELYVGISIGVAIYPKDGENQTDLIKTADQLMYAAKSDPNTNVAYS